jgi:hypothetical protein
LPEPRVAGSPSLVDVDEKQPGGFGAPQAGGAEQVQQREVALALPGPAVGHAQQPRPLVVCDRTRLAAADELRAPRPQLLRFDAERLGQPAQGGECLATLAGERSARSSASR